MLNAVSADQTTPVYAAQSESAIARGGEGVRQIFAQGERQVEDDGGGRRV